MIQLCVKLLALLSLACFAVTTAKQSLAQEVRWTRSPQQAVDMAHQSGKMILVSVGADWCHYCKKMDTL